MSGVVTKTPLPAQLQSFLAFDFGIKRTGVAFGSRLMASAQPQATVNAQGDARWALIKKRIDEWQPNALVVGVPMPMDLAEAAAAAHVAAGLATRVAAAAACGEAHSWRWTMPGLAAITRYFRAAGTAGIWIAFIVRLVRQMLDAAPSSCGACTRRERKLASRGCRTVRRPG